MQKNALPGNSKHAKKCKRMYKNAKKCKRNERPVHLFCIFWISGQCICLHFYMSKFSAGAFFCIFWVSGQCIFLNFYTSKFSAGAFFYMFWISGQYLFCIFLCIFYSFGKLALRPNWNCQYYYMQQILIKSRKSLSFTTGVVFCQLKGFLT